MKCMSCFWLIAAAALAVSGCSEASSKAPPVDDTTAAVKADDGTGEAKPDEKGEEDESLKEHMKGHFTAIVRIQKGLIDGKLDDAKKHAQWLVDHGAHDAAKGWEPHIEAVKAAAEDLVRSKDLSGAAVSAAALGAQCANCHRATTAITSFAWEEPPGPAKDPKTHMQRHQWAAKRLWEGLVGPSDQLWNQGAEALLEAPLHTEDLAKGEHGKAVADRASTVHALGQKALQTTAREERRDLYAELLKTCVGCHEMARGKATK